MGVLVWFTSQESNALFSVRLYPSGKLSIKLTEENKSILLSKRAVPLQKWMSIEIYLIRFVDRYILKWSIDKILQISEKIVLGWEGGQADVSVYASRRSSDHVYAKIKDFVFEETKGIKDLSW